ncbi:MAG: septum formation initiator family protein [Desulfurivibrionaceae bacterium]|nr:septum formation initiator family protein [Desulfobulbales bacterium]MDT8334207.1 septum formation initiator family protein [Desulfurivibrionaceae bacterium]
MSTRKRDHKTRKLIKMGWVAVLLISAWVLFSPWGAVRHYRVSKNLRRIEAANAELRDNNRQLREEIDRLLNDPAYIEDIARQQHGLLRNNEFVYQFPNKKKR